MMFIIGAFFSKMFQNKADKENKILRNSLVAISIYISILCVRDTTLLLLRKYFYLVFIPRIMIYVLTNKMERECNNEKN